MTRKRFGYVAMLLLLAVAGGGAGLVWALLQVPDFYAEALVVPTDPAVRKQAAKKLVQRTLQLVDDIQRRETWAEEFTQQQVNSWLAEDLHAKFSGLVPPGVRDPRVQFGAGAVHVGFRYEEPNWGGVVSVRVKPWIREPNQLAVEIESVRAGLVPIPLDHLLHEISERFETEGWHMEWRRHASNDVVVLYFDSVAPGDPVLEAIEIGNGWARIAGSRLPDRDDPDSQETKGSSADEPPADVSAQPVPRMADQAGKN